MQLQHLSAWELSQKLKGKELSLSEVVGYFTQRITKLNPQLNAVLKTFSVPQSTVQENASPLWGVPILIKDNMCIKNQLVTCASKILDSHRAGYDATVISRLKKAGLVLLGTTNMDEFAFGSSCENSCYGPTYNPWNRECVPGGSSGGSAAGVAAGLSPLALGSDTGGSIRQPASFCGVVGLKPTYGRVSRFGLVAFGSSLDQIGPFSRHVKDAAYLLEIIAGYDRRDSTSSDTPVPSYNDDLSRSIKGLKIGLVKDFFVEGMHPEVEQAVKQAMDVLVAGGAQITPLSLKHSDYAVPCYYILASSEASTNLSRFDGIRYGLRSPSNNINDLYFRTRAEGFGKEVKRRIMLGTFSLSSGYYHAYYGKAQKVRSLIKQDFQEAFTQYDLLLAPTSPTPAFALGEKIQDPLKMYLSDIYTISCNLAGVPSLSIPCGFTKHKLPIGMQLIGNHFDEKTLFGVGAYYQSKTSFHKMFPAEYE